jgi:hypothetical protein
VSTADFDGLVRELKTSSRISLSLVVLGIVFLLGTVLYSATRLAPLEEQVSRLQGEIESKQAELRRISDAVARAAQPLSSAVSNSNIEGWLYVGRLGSNGTWAPLSEGVVPVPDENKTDFTTVITRKNAPIVANAENSEMPRAGNAAGPSTASGQVQFVKPETRLAVIRTWKEKSIGGGYFVWAKVSVAAKDVVTLPSAANPPRA